MTQATASTRMDVHESRAELAVGLSRARFDSGAPPRYVAALAQALLEVASA